MPTLYRKSWPLGWTPCDSYVGGRVDGLARVDNLTQDENGVWRLINGTKKVSSGPFSNYVNAIYSRYIAGKKLRYISTNGSVYRNYGALNTLADFDSGTIASGGAVNYAAFGTGFGHNFIISGDILKKDNGSNIDNVGGSNPSFDLGIPALPAPSATPWTLYSQDVSGRDGSGYFTQWEPIENGSAYNDTAGFIELDSSPTTFRAITQIGRAPTVNIDCKTLTPGYTGYDSDLFHWDIRVADTYAFTKVRLEFLLESPTSTSYTSDNLNYYYKEWTLGDAYRAEDLFNPMAPDLVPKDITSQELTRIQRQNQDPERAKIPSIRPGQNIWSRLECFRSAFTRIGDDATKDWATVKGIRVIFTGTQQQNYVFKDLVFQGGPLTGSFTYKVVGVYSNNNYKEFGIPSAESPEYRVTGRMLNVGITHVKASGAQVNEIWLYRRSEYTGGFYKVLELPNPPNGTFYVSDTATDAELLQRNEQLPIYATVLPSYIIDMVCDYFNRNLYLTTKEVVPSYKDNPGLYDSRYKLDIGGDEAEVNLFMRKVSNSSILIGTTKDIYELSGDGSEIEISEGVVILDYKIRALGVATPPVCNAATVYDGSLIYLAHDGWHILQGSSNQVFSQELSLLYQKEARGVDAVIVPIANNSVVNCIVTRNKFWASLDHTYDGRAMHVFSFKTKTWEYRRFNPYGENPQALFVEEDGSILYSTTSAGDKYLREYDTGQGYDNGGGSPAADINFQFQTVFDDNLQPRNRKDLYTLRTTIYTNATSLSVYLEGLDDAGVTQILSNTLIPTGATFQTYSFALNTAIPLPIKSVRFTIIGSATIFSFQDFSVDYDIRPEQQNFLILRPDNFGVAGRKRVPNLAMMIDTLGQNVVFTPKVDNTNKTTSTINTLDKSFYNHTFAISEVGYMFGGVLSGNLFEFYGLIPPRNIEVLPDPQRYKLSNYSNLGTPARKRIIQYARIIDTNSQSVAVSIYIDGVAYNFGWISSSRKQTHIFPFSIDVIGTDVACELSGAYPFEDYGESLEDCILEKLPPLTKYKFSNVSNLGTTSRKRIVQYARTVDPKGGTVVLTPYIDGIAYSPMNLTGTGKKTYIYSFPTDTIGTDIACELGGTSGFEDYGENLDQCVTEKLPRSTKFINLSTTNFGIANKKRVRALPIVINTRGQNVTYIPTVDGVAYPGATLNSTEKRTLFYYFTADSFGIDYGGTLQGSSDFEFYELMTPEIVQVLPVQKSFDQIGPIEFNKIGKVRELRLRLLAQAVAVNYEIFSADTSILTGQITTIPDKENSYVIEFPRGVNVTICRVTLISAAQFHRISAEFKVHIEGKTPEFAYVNEKGEVV